jgi:hypothetical protein
MQFLYGSITALNSMGSGGIAIFAGAQGVFKNGSIGSNKIPSGILTSGIAELSSTVYFSNEDYGATAENRPASIGSYLCIKY